METTVNLLLYAGLNIVCGFFLVLLVLIVPYIFLGIGRWIDYHYDYNTPQIIFKWVVFAVLFVLSLSWMVFIWSTPIAELPRSGMVSYSTFKAGRDVKEAPPPTQIELGNEIKRYILVSYRPPKHFYVTLKDTTTNEVLENVYVSKHCNSASQLKNGEEYNIPVRKYAWSNSPNIVRYEFKGLYGVFCG